MLSTPSAPGPIPSKLAHTVLAETIAQHDPSHRPHPVAISVRNPPPQPPAGARTTVLPRVEMIGEEAQLVFDGKERFEKLRTLGEGGIGEVVGAQDHDIGRKVAIKRLHAHVQSPAALARFVDEIRTIGKLEHPNIVPIHDVGTDENGELYFVMKYVDGETLEDVIQKLAAGDPQYHLHYTFERRVEIFRSILEALAFAHDKGIIHRDIKPANVMIGRFGEVLLMDWGIARSVRGDAPEIPWEVAEAPQTPGGTGRAFRTQVGSLVGTPLYMSPEQASARPLDERSDVYSACLVFMELLYLRHPLMTKASLEEVLAGARNEEISLFDRSNPHQPPVPAELMWFLVHGLKKDPAQRYPSIKAMIHVLDKRAEGCINVECPVTLAKSATLKSTRFIDAHPTAFLALAGGFAALFLTLVALAVRGFVV